MKKVSVIVPCYNEQEVLPELFTRLTNVAGSLGLEWEVICVDDGSTDNTWRLLSEQYEKDPRWRAISLSRNFGHQIAVTTGINHASGDAVVLIDADLQDPPELIPKMLEKWQEGYDVIYGTRTERQGETRFKCWTARMFYRLMEHLTDVDIPLDTGDFRLLDRKVVNALCAMPERHRFVRGMVSWAGFKQTALLYERAPRYAGQTKFSFFRMLNFALDGIFSFSWVPLRIASWTGFLVSGLAFVGIIYALVMRLFTNVWVTGWTAIIISVLFIGGVQLIFLGVIGEYIGRIYTEGKQRPLYLVQTKLGFDEKDDIDQTKK
jgi:glycosyltransferase involved in cell wall biosynthesis